jgi:hypothetical protein
MRGSRGAAPFTPRLASDVRNDDFEGRSAPRLRRVPRRGRQAGRPASAHWPTSFPSRPPLDKDSTQRAGTGSGP